MRTVSGPRGRADHRPRRELGIQHLPLKLALFLGLCALPGFGALQVLLRNNSAIPVAVYGLASGLTYGLYWSDKRKARTDRWRTPEKILHGAELLGGWPGALLAQQQFRHKTRKLSYQAAFWGIVAVHQLFWIDRLLLGGRCLHKMLGSLLFVPI